jgi:thermostable 8-oxoguanine DNA glycosylase
MIIEKDYYTPDTVVENLNERDLQARLIFSVIVAGKNAKFANNVIDKLFGKTKQLPFNAVRQWIKEGSLRRRLKSARSGNYNKLVNCLPKLVELDPRTATLDELETVKGIGPKTSRFYHLWIGKNTRCAALDVHILKFLRALGYDAPKNTPTGKKYKELEEAFLTICEQRGISPNQLDADVWLAYSSKDEKKIADLFNGV